MAHCFLENMAGKLKSSFEIDISACEALQQSEGPSSSLRHKSVNRQRRHLSRTITQPRGLYESIIDIYGPTTGPDVLQAEEAAQVEEAYRSLQALSCSSDTETCSSHEESQETQFDQVHDPKDEFEIRDSKDNNVQHEKTRRRSDSQKRTDQEWAKSILSRRTGYGCLQRNQVVKYISHLVMSVSELETEVLNLSPQVILLDQHRWILQEENKILKHKIAEVSRYQLFKGDKHSALQRELRLLKLQQADQRPRRQQDAMPSSLSGESHDDHHPTEEVARIRHPADVQQGSQDLQGSVPHMQTTNTDEPGRLPQESNETAAKQEASLRPEKAPTKDDGKVTRQELILVKWPSSLYRSVSAIRKDVLELAVEESRT